MRFIQGLLSATDLTHINSMLKNAEFVDGRLSAGKHARDVKNNQELAQESALHNSLNQRVMGALWNNEAYQEYALPATLATAFYARYEQGMHYGDHVDDPMMGPDGSRYRCDISTTVFLNDDYDGGELVLYTEAGEKVINAQAGAAIVYPSTYLHRVNPVQSGSRLVAVTWAQSHIKSAEHRSIISQLSAIEDQLTTDHVSLNQIAQIKANLFRLWA